jgi:hypothetical protein
MRCLDGLPYWGLLGSWRSRQRSTRCWCRLWCKGICNGLLCDGFWSRFGCRCWRSCRATARWCFRRGLFARRGGANECRHDEWYTPALRPKEMRWWLVACYHALGSISSSDRRGDFVPLIDKPGSQLPPRSLPLPSRGASAANNLSTAPTRCPNVLLLLRRA